MSVEYWPTTTTTTSRTTITTTTTPTKTSLQNTPKAFESGCDTSEIDSEVILINFQKFDLTNNNNNNEDSNGSRSSSNYNITTSNQGDNNTYSHQFFNLPEEEVEEKIKISDSISRIAYNKELGVDSNLTEECDI